MQNSLLTKFWQRYAVWMGKGSLAFIDQAFFSLSTFVVNILLARWLDDEAYGAFAVAYSFFLLVSGLLNALLLEPMSVVSPFTDEKALQYRLRILFWLYVGVSALSVVVFAGGVLIYGCLQHFSPQVLVAISAMIVSLPGVYLYWFSRRIAYTAHRPAMAAVLSVICFFSFLLSLWILYEFGWFSVWNVQLVLGILSGLIGAGMFVYLVRLPFVVEKAGLRSAVAEHWGYGRWVLVSSLLYWLSNSVYTPLVGWYAGLESAGGFRAIQNLVLPVTQMVTALSLLVMPMAAMRWQTQGAQALERFSRWILAVLMGISIVYAGVVWLMQDVLVLWLYGAKKAGESYGAFAGLLFPLLMGVLVDTWRQGQVIPLSAIRRSEVFLWARIASTLSMFFIGLPLLWQFGIVGAAWGLAFHNGIAGMVLWQFGKRWLR